LLQRRAGRKVEWDWEVAAPKIKNAYTSADQAQKVIWVKDFHWNPLTTRPKLVVII